MPETWREDLNKDLQDPELAMLYGAAQAKDAVAITLAKARIEHGLTQQEMAHKVKVSQPYIAKLERGDANPTIGVVGGMLAAIGLRLVTNVGPLVSPRVEQTEPSLRAIREANKVAADSWASYDRPADDFRIRSVSGSAMSVEGGFSASAAGTLC
ncbi:MAG: helix-turn-helix transcriptional regulator [Patescibacteria group bacterium]